MAKKPKAPAADIAATIPETFEADALYSIRVGAVCEAANTTFLPAHRATVKGHVAEAIRAHLIEAVVVEPRLQRGAL